MKGRFPKGGVLVVLAAATAGAWLFSDGAARSQDAGSEAIDLVEGRALYAEYCASCHGANLEGQPNWRSPGPDGRLPAPPHDATGHTWHHPDSMLHSYTKLGGKAFLARQGMEFDSGMPAFGDQLSDAQILNIIEFIKSTWPERQRTVQAERSEADRQQGDKIN
ncbi:c-type cytochrome [Thalassovita aquimarina]|uniref:Cytochrome c n=2 Tax=Thalassovita aquimarina TaxID=2785917 RepID=A0ABS5HWX6_9RHOB|nr:cytochrome c [Thalassovita aquimarina]